MSRSPFYENVNIDEFSKKKNSKTYIQKIFKLANKYSRLFSIS